MEMKRVEPNMIEEFQHVSITCRDLDRSVRFYETIGLKVIEPVRELDSDALAEAMQLPKGHIKVLHLAPHDGTRNMFIDLVQWLEPTCTGDTYGSLNHVGINRVAFRVSDIDATVKALQERGVSFLTREARSFGPIRTIVTTDPDGVFVQLLEWL